MIIINDRGSFVNEIHGLEKTVKILLIFAAHLFYIDFSIYPNLYYLISFLIRCGFKNMLYL